MNAFLVLIVGVFVEVNLAGTNECKTNALQILGNQYAHFFNQDKFDRRAEKWQNKCTAAFPDDEPKFCDPCYANYRHAVGRILIPRKVFESEIRMQQLGRHRLIETQPQTIPRFTREGYKLIQWPTKKKHLLEKLIAGVPGYRKSAQFEPYELFNAYVSSWESNVWVSQLPNPLLQSVTTMIQRILEKWSGVDLELTRFFGPRMYRNGSLLNMHVDVVETHIISAIVHVAHEDVLNPWPLEIVNHAGEVKHITNDTIGMIILYESAKILHGRPTPFLGREYTNLFVHFRPVGWQNPKQWIRDKRKDKPRHWEEDWDPKFEL